MFEDSYETTPITSAAQLEVRFMHQFEGGSLDYEKRIIGRDSHGAVNGAGVPHT